MFIDFLSIIFSNIAPYAGTLFAGFFLTLAAILIGALVWRVLPILREWFA